MLSQACSTPYYTCLKCAKKYSVQYCVQGMVWYGHYAASRPHLTTRTLPPYYHAVFCMAGFLLFTAGVVLAHRNTPGLWYTAVPLLILAAISALFTDRAQRLIHKVTGKRFFKPHNSEQPNLESRPSGGHIQASDIAISQHPDGTAVLLGSGSTGKVCL